MAKATQNTSKTTKTTTTKISFGGKKKCPKCGYEF